MVSLVGYEQDRLEGSLNRGRVTATTEFGTV